MSDYEKYLEIWNRMDRKYPKWLTFDHSDFENAVDETFCYKCGYFKWESKDWDSEWGMFKQQVEDYKRA